MFERYTDRARRVIVLAQDAARDMRHREVGTGHLLVGLIGEGGGVAFQALTALGVNPGRVREAVSNRHPGGDTATGGHLPFTPRLKKALNLALRESVTLGDSYVATEHLLLGLVAEDGNTGALALADFASLPAVRAKVLELLGSYAKPTAQPVCAGKDFEHHESPEFPGKFMGRWRCPACGDTGTIKDAMEKLIRLLPNFHRLQAQMLDRGAVFLLPSDATPGLLGQFYGRDIYRAPGLPAPMIGIPALPIPAAAGIAP